jgi:capsular exopolysaccharide synthesis family protein
MDLQDYLRMLRRGWPAILLITALFLGVASLYLVVAPKRYESGTSLLVSTNSPQDIGELSQGADFSSRAVTTYADIVDSATVLGPVASSLRPQMSVEDLAGVVTATARSETTLIDIAVAGNDPAQTTVIANAVAASASRVIPTLQSGVAGRPLVQVKQIRPAVEPTAPVSPKLKNVLAIGLIVGLCVGLATTIVAQVLDTRIRRIEDIQNLTDVPLLAVLPPLKQAQRDGLVVRDEPTGPSGEAFRTLRTNLRFMESQDRRSVVFAAVADDRDGAHVPANLAWSLAQAGRRVLLVDLDLRSSTVGDAFGIEAGTGLADVLTGRAELPAVVRHTQHPRLRVVTSGSPQPSPSDLLSAPSMVSVLRRMEHEYDYVILHAPPLLSYSDAAVVSAAAGGTFLTVAAGRNRGHELTAALAALANVRIKPFGLVLTGAKSPGTSGRVPPSDVREPVAAPEVRPHQHRAARHPAQPA